MIRSSWSMTLAVGVGICLGWAVARLSAPATPSPDHPVQASAAAAPMATSPAVAPPPETTATVASAALSTPASEPPADLDRSLKELVRLMKLGRPEDGASIAAGLGQLVTSARSDARLRRDIVSHFKGEKDETMVRTLATVISSFPPQEIRDMALQMAQGDPGQRANAYFLLARSPRVAASEQDVIQNALNTEQDVHVLTEVVNALGSRPALDPAQNQAALTRLKALAEHTDAEVRSASMRVLAQWDKTGDVAEPQVYKALTADNPELQTEALYALAASSLKSDRMKTALLQIASNDGNPAESRFMALRTLERYPLSQQEYAAYSRLSTAVRPPMAGGPPPQASTSSQTTADAGSAAFSPFLH